MSLCEVEEPVPAPNQVKLAISACGICGTDLHVLNDLFRNYPPVILGHEFVGRVVEKGSEVTEDFDPDARYAVLGATAVVSDQCRYYLSGDFMLSPGRRGMGHGVNGAFCPYACVRPDQLFRLADGVPELEGALVEPLAVAVHAVQEIACIQPSDTVLVSGPGPIGLLCLLVLVHQGNRTIVAGAGGDAGRLRLAEKLGAARVVDVSKEDLKEVVSEETEGLGVDAVFEVAGVQASATACLETVRPLGSYTQVGHFGREIPLPLDHVAFKQLTLRGSVGYRRESWARTMELLAENIEPSRIVTHRFPLVEWEKGVDLFQKKDAVKVILHPS